MSRLLNCRAVKKAHPWLHQHRGSRRSMPQTTDNRLARASEWKCRRKKIDNCQLSMSHFSRLVFVFFPSAFFTLKMPEWRRTFRAQMSHNKREENRHRNPIIPQLCHFQPTHTLGTDSQLGENVLRESITAKHETRKKKTFLHFSIIFRSFFMIRVDIWKGNEQSSNPESWVFFLSFSCLATWRWKKDEASRMVKTPK